MKRQTSAQVAPRLRLEALEARETPALVGGLDPSFGAGGAATFPMAGGSGDAVTSATVVQTDGKVVAVGATGVRSSTISSNFLVVRFNPDGSPDMTFNRNTGRQEIGFGGTDFATAVALQNDGKIVVVGSGTANTSDFLVARLHTDGTLDESFNATQQGGRAKGTASLTLGGDDRAFAVGVQSTGKIVVAGTTDRNGTTDFGVVRFNADGTRDTSFNAGIGRNVVRDPGDDEAAALAIYTDGPNKDKVVVVGEDSGDFGVYRFNADGTDDIVGNGFGFSEPGAGPDISRATGVVITADGKVVVSGTSDAAGDFDFAILRLDADLNRDPSFDPADARRGRVGGALYDLGGSESGGGILLEPGGRVVMAGTSSPTRRTVIRVNTDGSLDTSFNAPNNGVYRDAVSATGFGILEFANSTSSTILNVVLISRTAGGRIILPGRIESGRFSDLSVTRLIGTVEEGTNLAVGGRPVSTASVFAPAPDGTYGPATPSVVDPFGILGVNARTAVGDVNGDGVPDVILVSGPGGPTRVAVISGGTGAVLVFPRAALPGSESFTGGGFAAAGDFDNDGRWEVVVTPDVSGGPRVVIFSLRADGGFESRASFFGVAGPDFSGGARASVGDVNADGVVDLVVAAGFGGGPRVAVIDGKAVFTTQAKLVGDFFAFSEVLRDGAYVAVGDVTGDGFADLVFGAGDGGGPQVLVVSGQLLLTQGAVAAVGAPVASYFAGGGDAGRGGIRVAVTDADGDHRADVVAGTGKGQPSRARVYLGNTFTGGAPPVHQELDPFSGEFLADGVFVG